MEMLYMNGKNSIIIKEWVDEKGQKHRIIHFFSLGKLKEAEYVEIRKGVWQKVFGTEKNVDTEEQKN